jgi:NADPH:quinone reductase-like Zn-dependent oxidoreductase
MTAPTRPIDDLARALWYVAPGQAEIREEKLSPPGPGEARVRASYGSLSLGTERLVLAGRVPASEFDRMRAPFMGGNFPFPVKYGYSIVGSIEAGPADLVHQFVFVLYPHQNLFNVPVSAVVPLPSDLPPSRAVLAANMETALNAVWDGSPGPGDRIAVIGAGAVGALVAFLCGRIPGARVTLVDINPGRAEVAHRLGVDFSRPAGAPTDCDLVFHASATATGLATALYSCGEEAAVIDLSWYGEGVIEVPLGAAFHSRRLRLISSQVGQVAPSRRPRWTRNRRLAAALSLLRDDRLDALITPAVTFLELPGQLSDIINAKSNVLCQLIRYA